MTRTGHIPRMFSIAAWSGMLSTAGVLAATAFSSPVLAQQTGQSEARPQVIVQPGAPGKPTRILPTTTTGTLPPVSAPDVQFMQGMIMHHAQAVEMTALIDSHTENKEVRALGARINRSQADEIKFMKRWLAARGQPETMPDMPGMDMSHGDMSHEHMSHGNMSQGMMLMPGMLTPEQMKALREAKGEEFDRLFLTGMIQHHGGALTMVKDLYNTAGAGQDAELFDFTTEVDSGQRAEIRIMQGMLDKKPLGDK